MRSKFYELWFSSRRLHSWNVVVDRQYSNFSSSLVHIRTWDLWDNYVRSVNIGSVTDDTLLILVKTRDHTTLLIHNNHFSTQNNLSEFEMNLKFWDEFSIWIQMDMFSLLSRCAFLICVSSENSQFFAPNHLHCSAFLGWKHTCNIPVWCASQKHHLLPSLSDFS